MAEDLERNATLAEAANAFLSSLPPEEKEQTRVEIFKFIRWLGTSRQVKDVSPLDVASYGEQITPSIITPLRSFLTYIRKKGFTSTNLAPHLRAKKTTVKIVTVWQTEQPQVTLTPEGYAKLEKELAELKSERTLVIDEMKKAAVDKDFRENAPLAAARERKARLDGRIKEIEAILNQAQIIKEARGSSKAKFGDKVVLQDLSSGRELVYTLVDPREANPAKGKLSVASPLGKAILDKEKGEIVEVSAPAGTFRCRITDILASSSEEKSTPLA